MRRPRSMSERNVGEMPTAFATWRKESPVSSRIERSVSANGLVDGTMPVFFI
jgi:hypothetical protein